jgi:hypothetical protein
MSGDYLANRMINSKIKEKRDYLSNKIGDSKIKEKTNLKNFESAYDFHKALEDLNKEK